MLLLASCRTAEGASNQYLNKMSKYSKTWRLHTHIVHNFDLKLKHQQQIRLLKNRMGVDDDQFRKLLIWHPTK